MKKQLWISSIIVVIFALLTACGGELPDKPSMGEVEREVAAAAENVLLGEVKDSGEKILFESIIVNELELSWVEDDDTLIAEITVFLGNEDWRSENKVSMKLNYRVNSEGEWESSGASWDEIVVSVIPRK